MKTWTAPMWRLGTTQFYFLPPPNSGVGEIFNLFFSWVKWGHLHMAFKVLVNIKQECKTPSITIVTRQFPNVN